MNDVARAAGVSLKTVSRVVNEPDAVRPQTREKVKAAMADLGFRTNFAARSLKLGRYKTIGVVLSSLKGGNVSVLDGIATAAAEKGYALTVVKTRPEDSVGLFEASRRLSILPVDGMIFSLNRMVDDFESYRAPTDLKTVIITPFEHPTCSTVSDDQEGGAYMATHYLIERGHEFIHFVGGPAESLTCAMRARGWSRALKELGLEPSPPAFGDWTCKTGYAAGKKLSRNEACTAVLAANDDIAWGLICALREEGRRVPEDVSVIGFDNSLSRTVPDCGLTSVSFCHHDLGIRAFTEVVEGLGTPGDKSRVLIPGNLVERTSVRDMRHTTP